MKTRLSGSVHRVALGDKADTGWETCPLMALSRHARCTHGGMRMRLRTRRVCLTRAVRSMEAAKKVIDECRCIRVRSCPRDTRHTIHFPMDSIIFTAEGNVCDVSVVDPSQMA